MTLLTAASKEQHFLKVGEEGAPSVCPRLPPQGGAKLKGRWGESKHIAATATVVRTKRRQGEWKTVREEPTHPAHPLSWVLWESGPGLRRAHTD